MLLNVGWDLPSFSLLAPNRFFGWSDFPDDVFRSEPPSVLVKTTCSAVFPKVKLPVEGAKLCSWIFELPIKNPPALVDADVLMLDAASKLKPLLLLVVAGVCGLPPLSPELTAWEVPFITVVEVDTPEKTPVLITDELVVPATELEEPVVLALGEGDATRFKLPLVKGSLMLAGE